ncbi:hypothetical protein ACFOSC_24670 [Streptantibioticus rubrisoli]|uniref:Uncharacterized protein n=1 Tax=Streptantibioticus rubrisoli TaxID=1387313 RepID=A0ABT1PB87_9ACTN|nr:hypothetical protein [Streptantibioticus rubrisoli]MCQ4042634.1 hypothetical protein [Streptantibioticus rubrisoli]
MRIELTWPGPEAGRTLTIPVPGIRAEALRPALDHVRRAGTPALRGALACAEPVVSSVAGAAGAGALVQLALPFVVRRAQRSLCESPHRTA